MRVNLTGNSMRTDHAGYERCFRAKPMEAVGGLNLADGKAASTDAK